MSAFLGFCHVSGGDTPSRLVAAAFCADRSQFDALVGAALAAQGYRLDWAEDVLPAGPWVARHPAAGGAALARLVHEGRHVALGPMTPLGGADAMPEEDQNWLHVEEIGPITPLDAQFGVHPKKSVPDALHDVLFGQPEPTEAERAAFGADTPPLATYAVLDAAKMPYLLTGLLESSGLRYQSLFQGEAQQGLGEHAPYLVELKEGHDFTRRLFTGTGGAVGLWERELGVFLRSRTGFDALRRHLRKFTRLPDENGRWFYFRFWEAHVLQGLASSEDDTALGLAAALVLPVETATRWILVDVLAGRARRLGNRRPVRDPAFVPRLLPAVREALHRSTTQAQMTAELSTALSSADEMVRDAYAGDPRLAELWSALCTARFEFPDQRINAVQGYLRMAVAQRQVEAWAILSRQDQGPKVRLWHLARALEGSA